MNPIAVKETFKGKLNIYGTEMNHNNGHVMVIVGQEGKKKYKRKISATRVYVNGITKDYSFIFNGTEWLLDYDFGLILNATTGDTISRFKYEKAESGGSDEQYPVFVYGTLRKGMWNHAVIEGMYEKGEDAITQGAMYHNGSYPYLVEGKDVAHGELYHITPKHYRRVMMRLDGLEGYYEKGSRHNHYNRELVDVALLSGEIVKAWCYFGNDVYLHRLTRVKDGDFVRWAKDYSPGKLSRGYW